MFLPAATPEKRRAVPKRTPHTRTAREEPVMPPELFFFFFQRYTRLWQRFQSQGQGAGFCWIWQRSARPRTAGQGSSEAG